MVDERNAVAHRGGKLVRGVEEAAVAGDREHRHVAPRILRAERGGKAPAEIVLIAGRQERARLVHRQRKRAAKPICVTSSTKMPSSGSSARIAVEEGELRRELREPLAHPGLPLLHFRRARRARAVVRGQHVEQAAQDRLGITDERHRRPAQPLRLLGIGIDADDRKIVVDAPLGERIEHAACRRRARRRPRPTIRGRAAA